MLKQKDLNGYYFVEHELQLGTDLGLLKYASIAFASAESIEHVQNSKLFSISQATVQ